MVQTTAPYVTRMTSEESWTSVEPVGWLGTAALMMKTQIGLGVLSIPAVFDVLGLILGVICLIIIAVMTTWSDHIVSIFKLNHPEVYGVDHVGQKLFGTFIMIAGKYGSIVGIIFSYRVDGGPRHVLVLIFEFCRSCLGAYLRVRIEEQRMCMIPRSFSV